MDGERAIALYKKQKSLLKPSIKNIMNDITKEATLKGKAIITNGARSGRLYHYNGRIHQASAPFEPPANMSGRLANSFANMYHRYNNTHFGTIGNTAEYAMFLENGTRKMQPRPFMIKLDKYARRQIFVRLLRLGDEIGRINI